MAAATTTAAPKVDDLLLALADAPVSIGEVQAKFSLPVLATAWVRGWIEFGRTKHCVIGCPDGRHCVPGIRDEEKRIGSTLVIEDGIEWSGPKKATHGPLADILAEKMPQTKYHQVYALEVKTSRPNEPERWEWLKGDAEGRETRFARKDIKPADCAALWQLVVRLTDKGIAAIQGE